MAEGESIVVVGDEHLSEIRTIGWTFRNFARLDHQNGHKVKGVDPITCHGHSWSFRLYPRGFDADCDSNFVSLYLRLNFADDTPDEVSVKIKFRIGSQGMSSTHIFSKTSPKNWGFKKALRRSVILDPQYDFLEDGKHLAIKIDIQIQLDKPKPWSPKNQLQTNMLKMLESGKHTDVTFTLEDKMFRAHHIILANCAPALAELAESSRETGQEVPITKVKPSVFQALLRFIYAEQAPSPTEMNAEQTCELLEAADYAGCSGLKLLMESRLIQSGIKVETAMKMLLFAKAHNCPLLEEEAMNFITVNQKAVVLSPQFAELEVSSPPVALEVMKAPYMKKLQPENDSDFDHMNVATLRRKLEDADLSVDGTKQMLVKRLKTHHASSE